MFALEITFQDGVSQSETIFVRRPQALIGGSDSAHVVIEDMTALNYQLRLVRDVGRTFRLAKVSMTGSPEDQSDSIYTNDTELDLGPIKLHITALDSDLLVRDTEPPDRAGVRILRQASATRAPTFPAVLVSGGVPMVISFDRAQPILIGRAKQCALRLDSADVSAQHARLGFENGEFWIEDLGSTNGTFVNQQQISGKVSFAPTTPVVIGREATILGVTSEDHLQRKDMQVSGVSKVRSRLDRAYPILFSMSEVARPARIVFQPGKEVNVGRDPTSDMWLGAPHVSRQHLSLILSEDGSELKVIDRSTNGTAYEGGVLRRGDTIALSDKASVLDFGGGVTVAICFSAENEQRYISTHGAPDTFARPSAQDGELSHRKPSGSSVSLERQYELSRQMAGGPQWLPRFVRHVLATYREAALSWKILMLLGTLAICLVVVVVSIIVLPFVR